MVALLFVGHGSYQHITGGNIFVDISQASVSRCLEEVVNALNQPEIIRQFIHFPSNMVELRDARVRSLKPMMLSFLHMCVHIYMLNLQIQQ